MPPVVMRDIGAGPEPMRNPSKVWRLDLRRSNEITETVRCGRCPQRRRLGEISGTRTKIKAATGDGLVALSGGVWRWRCPGRRCRAEHPIPEDELLAAYIVASATAERTIVLPYDL
jgi:hypothetical protein